MTEPLYFCINLERAPDRRALMEDEARRAGISLRFIRAVDGSQLDVDAASGYDLQGRLRHAPGLKANEVACALSHKAALTAFLESGASSAVVLEDDAIFSDRFRDFVNAVAASKVPWSAVNLENRNGKLLKPALIRFDCGVGLHASAWLSAGAIGWLYSREGAERMVRSLNKFRHAYDTHIGLFWRHGITPLCAHPPVVSASGMPSTIVEKGTTITFAQKELSFPQFVRARRERIEHEVRKEIAARFWLARRKLALAAAALKAGPT
jgi:glycosyl transferase, family 25